MRRYSRGTRYSLGFDERGGSDARDPGRCATPKAMTTRDGTRDHLNPCEVPVRGSLANVAAVAEVTGYAVEIAAACLPYDARSAGPAAAVHVGFEPVLPVIGAAIADAD